MLDLNSPPNAALASKDQRTSAWERLWETEPPVFPLRLGPDGPWPKVRRFTPAFLTSTFLQSALIFFLYTFPFALLIAWLEGPQPVKMSTHTQLTMIKLKPLGLADYLPYIKMAGAAKAPGRAAKLHSTPKLGASHFDPRITIVSNPPNPDNSLLTLKNLTRPPDPTPPKDLKIPDAVAGGPEPIPAPPKEPAPAPEKVDTPTPPVEQAAEPPPPPKPVFDPSKEVPVVPHVSTEMPPPPPIVITAKLPDLPAPHLEIPAGPPPPPAPPVKPAPAPEAEPAPPAPPPKEAAHKAGDSPDSSAPGGKAAPATAEGEKSPGGGPQLMSLSVNPAPLKDIWPQFREACTTAHSPSALPEL